MGGVTRGGRVIQGQDSPWRTILVAQPPFGQEAAQPDRQPSVAPSLLPQLGTVWYSPVLGVVLVMKERLAFSLRTKGLLWVLVRTLAVRSWLDRGRPFPRDIFLRET